jgi:hypothetical protein
MPDLTRVTEALNGLIEKIVNQPWFQELKSKWEELDPQSRMSLKLAGVALSLVGLVFMIFSSIWSVYSLKKELKDKKVLSTLLQSANDEMLTLKSRAPSAPTTVNPDAVETPWSGYFEGIANSLSLDKTTVSIGQEKAGDSSDESKEAIYEIGLKHVNIKQVVRFALALESGSRPVKIKNLTVDTKDDPTGYLDATLVLSSFTLKVPK